MIAMNGTESAAETKRREESKAKLLERLRAQKPINIGPWTRDELYERDTSSPGGDPAGERGEVE